MSGRASSDRPTAAPQALLSIADAARYLNVSVSTMRRLALGPIGRVRAPPADGAPPSVPTVRDSEIDSPVQAIDAGHDPQRAEIHPRKERHMVISFTTSSRTRTSTIRS
jgi:hypothetical protein